jgi:hypothetical protein
MTHAIKIWLTARESKEPVVLNISTIVNRIHELLLLRCGKWYTAHSEIDITTLSALTGMEEALMRTAEHLSAWNNRRPKLIPFSGLLVFFSPDRASKVLKQDEKALNGQLAILLFSVSRHENDKANLNARGNPLPKPLTLPPESSDGRTTGNSFHNREVEMFWKDYIGAKVRTQSFYLSFVESSLWMLDSMGAQGVFLS